MDSFVPSDVGLVIGRLYPGCRSERFGKFAMSISLGHSATVFVSFHVLRTRSRVLEVLEKEPPVRGASHIAGDCPSVREVIDGLTRDVLAIKLIGRIEGDRAEGRVVTYDTSGNLMADGMKTIAV